MKPKVAVLLALLIASYGFGAGAEKNDRHESLNKRPAHVLMNTCLITNNVDTLVDFYGQVLQIPPKRMGRDYAEFPTGVGVLAIYSADAQEKYIPRSATPADNKSAILEFEVSDVDREYGRLKNAVKDWVKAPTTQPWGTRSIYFRDPDGNLVDFYAWVRKQ